MLDQRGVERERRYVELNGEQKIAYAEAGEGPPIVLIHGTLTTLEDMDLALSAGFSQDHRVTAFDRPGCGRSDVARNGSAGIGPQARQLLEAMDQLQLERPVLIGHSLGASVALAMAIDAPDRIGGVVALAPLVLPEPRLEQPLFGLRGWPGAGGMLAGVAEATTDRLLLPLLWRAMFLPQTMAREVEATFPFALAGRSAATVRTGEDALSIGAGLMRTIVRAPGCHVPVRIIGGDRDLVVRNGLHGRMLAAIMPDAAYIDMPGLGHMLHHFAAADIVEQVRRLTGSGVEDVQGSESR